MKKHIQKKAIANIGKSIKGFYNFLQPTNYQLPTNGYTLVEMLVAVAIFALAFGAIAAIFIGFTTAQGRATQAQKLLNEANYLFESVAREIRNNAVDYTCPEVAGNGAYGQTCYICLRTSEGGVVHIRYVNQDVQICRELSNPECHAIGHPENWYSLTPAGVLVTNMYFYVIPTLDPSKPEFANDWWGSPEFFVPNQPLTTIIMAVEGGTGKSKQTYHFQTAVSSRVYQQ